jgi:predicted MFS family arabinose efflux permease
MHVVEAKGRLTGRSGGFANAGRALASRNYRLYASGNFISLVGTWLQRIAVGWLAWQLTHSGTWLGLVAFADLFPTVVVSPFAGAVADRRDRLSVIMATQVASVVQAMLLAVLVWTGSIEIWSLFFLTLLLGVFGAFNQPARLALIPSLVDRTVLPSAVAINSISFNAARFIGPAAAGIIIAEGSIALAFAVNAFTYLAFMAALMGVKVKPEKSGSSGRTLFGASLDGYRYAARHPGIGSILLLVTAVSVFTRGFVELLPGFADEVFGRGAQGLAWLTAMIGLGAVAGGLWMVRRQGLEGLTRLVVATTLLMSVSLLAFTLTDIYWLALPCLFVTGTGMVLTGIAAQTLVQYAVVAEMRGRIMALYGMIFRGGPAVGSLVMGLLSSQFGLRAPVAGGALLCILAWLWARLRQDRIAEALETDAPGADA